MTAEKKECPRCKQSVEVSGGVFAYHNIAPMLRALCPNSKQPPAAPARHGFPGGES